MYYVINGLSSKRPKELWRVIHRILYPSPKPLQADPDRLNTFFLSTNERTLSTKPDKRSDLIDLVNSFSECPRTLHPFNLRCVSLMEVEKEIDNLRSDTSTGIDQIPVKFVKLAKVHISGPLTHVTNRCNATSSFPRLWRIAPISPIPKVDEPLSDAYYRAVSILPTLTAHCLHQRGSASRSYSIRIPKRSFNNYCFTGDSRRSNTGIKHRGGNTDGLRRL